MTKPKDTAEDFDAFDCSTASSRPAWWPDDWEWPPKLSNEPELRKSLEPLVEKDDPYSNCKSFEDCCKVLFECNAQMRKFFGTDKSMKTWTLKKNLSQAKPEYMVIDENGKLVCARNNQRDAVVAALRIAKETNRGAVQVVGE